VKATGVVAPVDGTWDLRLVPAALSVWGTTWVGLWLGWVVGAVLAGVAFAVASLVWLLARWRSWANVALAALVLGGVAAAGVALRVEQVEQHPLRAVASHGGRATVVATLEDAPKPIKGASFGDHRAEDRSLAHARLRAVEINGHRTAVGGEVVLLVPTQPWRHLIAGQEVVASGKAVGPRRAELTVATVQVLRPPESALPAPGWQRMAEDLRVGLRATSAAVLGPTAAALLPGLVTGDVGGLPSDVLREFTVTGLTHLVAVSGANLAIVCGAALLVLRLVGAGPLLSAVGAGLTLTGFVVLAGPQPSVLRAAVMGCIALLAVLLGRERAALPALSASALVLVLLSPDLAVSPGFALSVLATGGLVLLAPIWCAALRRRGVPAGWAEALAVPAAAHVVTAPLIAALSGEISVVAIGANLLAEPMIAPATVLGVLATVVAPLSAWLAGALVWLSGPEVEWVLAVAHHAAAIPGAVIEWPSGVMGGVLLTVATVAMLIMLRCKRIRWTVAIVALLAAAVLVPIRFLAPRWPVAGWSMVACDVGQGDALVLATGEPGEAVVVDTGPEPSLTANCLRRLGIRRVPLVVLTHLHADHVGGLSAVLADRSVGAVGLGGLHEPAWALADISRDATARGIPVVALRSGEQARWPGLLLDVLGPVGQLARTDSAAEANDASVVLRATTLAGRILLTGDVELEGQQALLSSGEDLRADILKIPHHGSRYTASRFVDAVHPRLALISVGAGNSYGHPSQRTIDAATHAGAQVFRTDQEGDIAVVPSAEGPRAVARGDPVRAHKSY
jgi:competence protein ComEC